VKLRRLGDLEFLGVIVDDARINAIRQSLLERARRLKEDICRSLGADFDVDSGKELSGVLRAAMNLKWLDETRTITTAILEQLAIREPTVRLIVDYFYSIILLLEISGS